MVFFESIDAKRDVSLPLEGRVAAKRSGGVLPAARQRFFEPENGKRHKEKAELVLGDPTRPLRGHPPLKGEGEAGARGERF